jgi:hypothetical protein
MADLMAIDAAYALRCMASAEKARARRNRYEVKHPERQSKNRGTLRNTEPYFIMWDGESPKDTGYSLFGSSESHEICHPKLTTEECFDLLLDAKREHPKGIFIIFGGRYDFDEICRESMPDTRLAMLKWNGHVYWHGYFIEQVEGKYFVLRKDGISVRVYEISGWFHKPYVEALRDYGIGTDRCIHGNHSCYSQYALDLGSGTSPISGAACYCNCDLCRMQGDKARRGEFTWSEIDGIRTYMHSELKYGPLLMNRIREICRAAGFNPTAWYGPSALAAETLRKHKVRMAMATCPEAVNLAAQYAYAGGRFEMFTGGKIGRGWSADKNTAYMAAALLLPSLAKGNWRNSSGTFEAGKFAVYRIRYDEPRGLRDLRKPYPLWRRYSNGNVAWVPRVDGWYWTPEAELVKDDPSAEFLEAWVFDEEDTSDRPFAFVRDLYAHRLVLKSLPADDPTRIAEKAFKWCLAAIYGHLARRVGWDKRHNLPPRYHQLEWAGFITSHCRADVYRVAMRAYEQNALISIDTDSVTSTQAIEVDYGTGLGQWEATTFDSGLFFQSGVYSLKNNGNWTEGKARGAERVRGKFAIQPELLARAIDTGATIRLAPKRQYTTVRMALNSHLENAGIWAERARTLRFGGDGKRYHNERWCNTICPGNGIHHFNPTPHLDPAEYFDITSRPHPLPWKKDQDKKPVDDKLLADTLWADTEHIDHDDYWLHALVRDKKKVAA